MARVHTAVSFKTCLTHVPRFSFPSALRSLRRSSSLRNVSRRTQHVCPLSLHNVRLCCLPCLWVVTCSGSALSPPFRRPCRLRSLRSSGGLDISRVPSSESRIGDELHDGLVSDGRLSAASNIAEDRGLMGGLHLLQSLQNILTDLCLMGGTFQGH